MSSTYLPLSLKYRSRTLEDLIGQDVLVQILTNAIVKDRLNGGIIFTGIRGTGKTSTARILARALNCSKRAQNSAQPCGTCKTCQEILLERHMDVIEIDAASHTSVDDIREIIESCKYKPIECKYKIYIIDEVHMLSKSAFNALLKTLEEPPSHVKFLFATTEIHKVPDTILSRCLNFELKPVPTNVLAQHFANILNQESIPAEIDALNTVARAAKGSVRDGLTMLEQVISFCNYQKITSEATQQILGYGDYTLAFETIKHTLLGNAKEAITAVREYFNSGGSALELLNKALTLTHWLICEKNQTPVSLTDAEIQDDFKQIAKKQLLDKLSIAGLSRIWQALIKGVEEIKFADMPNQAMEVVLIRVCYLSELPELSDLVNGLKNAPKVLSDIEQTSPPQLKISTVEQLLDALEKNKEVLTLNELKESLSIINFSPPVITITRKKDFKEDFPKRFTSLLNNLTQQDWKITIQQTDENAQSTPSIYEQEQKIDMEALSKVHNCDIIKTAEKLFPNAKIAINKEE